MLYLYSDISDTAYEKTSSLYIFVKRSAIPLNFRITSGSALTVYIHTFYSKHVLFQQKFMDRNDFNCISILLDYFFLFIGHDHQTAAFF